MTSWTKYPPRCSNSVKISANSPGSADIKQLCIVNVAWVSPRHRYHGFSHDCILDALPASSTEQGEEPGRWSDELNHSNPLTVRWTLRGRYCGSDLNHSTYISIVQTLRHMLRSRGLHFAAHRARLETRHHPNHQVVAAHHTRQVAHRRGNPIREKGSHLPSIFGTTERKPL